MFYKVNDRIPFVSYLEKAVISTVTNCLLRALDHVGVNFFQARLFTNVG